MTYFKADVDDSNPIPPAPADLGALDGEQAPEPGAGETWLDELFERYR